MICFWGIRNGSWVFRRHNGMSKQVVLIPRPRADWEEVLFARVQLHYGNKIQLISLSQVFKITIF